MRAGCYTARGMQIIVLGAGAIGSVFGAKLAATDDVTLVGRETHVHAINSGGLRVEGLASETISVRAATEVPALGPNALIIVTTKVGDTAAALSACADNVRDDTTVLCLQNGLGPEAIAREALGGRGVVIRGITQAGAIFERPGVVRYMVKGETVLEQHTRSGAIADTFARAELQCRMSEHIAADVWRKLIFNCVVNPITTMLGCEVGGIADPRLAPLKQAVINECIAVGSAEGVQLTGDFLDEIDRIYAPSQNIVSMLQDIRNGRRTEIDYLNGAVVAAGARHQIDCRANAGLTAIIKALEKRT